MCEIDGSDLFFSFFFLALFTLGPGHQQPLLLLPVPLVPVHLMPQTHPLRHFVRRSCIARLLFSYISSTANHEIEKPTARAAKPMMSPCLMTAAVGVKGESKEFVCATRLKVLCEAAVEAISVGETRETTGRGAVVEYTSLPDVVTDFIYPDLFGMGQDLLEQHLPYMSEAAK